MNRLWPLLVLLLSIIFLFQGYLFNNKILFPANFLSSFYNPWKRMIFPGWEHGIPHKPLGQDNIRYFYPTKKLVADQLKQGKLPLWNPYNFSGTPLLADGQSAVFYPPSILFLLLPTEQAFSVMVISVPILSFLFMYLLLLHYKLTNLSSFFGAFTFAFSGFFSVWMEENPAVSQTAIWLPLLVLLLDRWIFKRETEIYLTFIVTTAVMLTAGFLQISLYQLIFLLVYGLWRIKQNHSSKPPAIRPIFIVAAIVLAVGLAAAYIMPVFEAYRFSPREFSREAEIIRTYVVGWSHLVTLLIPDWLGNPGTYNYHGPGTYYDRILFVGAVPFMLVLFGLWLKKNNPERFYKNFTFAVILLGFSHPVTKWLYSQNIPVVSSMLPSRVFYLAAFTLSVLAAYGFEKLLRHSIKIKDAFATIARLSLYCLPAFFISLVLALAYWLETSQQLPAASLIRRLIVPDMRLSNIFLPIILRNTFVWFLVFGGTLFGIGMILISNKLRRSGIIFIIGLTLFSGLYYTRKSIYEADPRFLYPQNELLDVLSTIGGIDKVGYTGETSRIKANLNAIYGWSTPEGLNPVFPLRYGQLVNSYKDGASLTDSIPRIEAILNLSQDEKSKAERIRIMKLASLLGIRYILQAQNAKEVSLYGDVAWQNQTWTIFENKQYLPKNIVVHRAFVEPDDQRLINRLYDPSFDPGTSVLLSSRPLEADHDRGGQTTGASKSRILAYTPSAVTVEVEATQAGFLVLLDNYFPGWSAYVDGKEAPIYRADFTFRAVSIPAGYHSVRFIYNPKSFRYGMLVSLLSAAGIFLLSWYLRKSQSTGL